MIMNKKISKTIFGFIAVLAIAAVAGINVNISTNDISKNLSELAATNLEALAQDEGGESDAAGSKKCKETVTPNNKQVPCGYGGYYETYNGSNYECYKETGGTLESCKRGFQGTRYDCNNVQHTSTASTINCN
jgi:hypothetical protein